MCGTGSLWPVALWHCGVVLRYQLVISIVEQDGDMCFGSWLPSAASSLTFSCHPVLPLT